jgi:hypothetical protein
VLLNSKKKCIFAKKKYFIMMSFYKKTLIFFYLFFPMSFFADAQVFKGEIIGGFNLTQVDGDLQIGYRKFGAHAGVGVMFPFEVTKQHSLALSMEILLNQRGARKRNYYYNIKDTNFDISHGKFEYLLRLNYVSIPFIFHYAEERSGFTFGAGFAYNRMFSSSELEYDIQQTYDTDTVKRLNPNDFTVLADVRIRIWQQLKFGFRFEYSMFSLRTRTFPANIFRTGHPETRKQYNNSLSFYLVYMLNEKRVEKQKKSERIEKIYYY